MKQERFIVRSRAVFTGLTDRPVPAAIAVEGQKIRALLSWTAAGNMEIGRSGTTGIG